MFAQDLEVLLIIIILGLFELSASRLLQFPTILKTHTCLVFRNMKSLTSFGCSRMPSIITICYYFDCTLVRRWIYDHCYLSRFG